MATWLLVTTGIVERNAFGNILLAGDWCRHLLARFQDGATVRTLDYPIACADAVAINQEVKDAAAVLLSRVRDAYNDVFSLDKGVDYYNIVVGRWMFHFLHNVYEKQKILRAAAGQYSNLVMESCGLQYAESFDTDHYDQLSYSSHDWNFRLYSALAELHRDISKTYVRVQSRRVVGAHPRAASEPLFKRSVQFAACALNRMLRRKMVLVVSPNYAERGFYNSVWFFIRSGGEIVHYSFSPAPVDTPEFDVKLRKKLSANIHCGGEGSLLCAASSLIFYFAPLSLVEGFTPRRREAMRWLTRNKNLRRLFTANGIHTNEPFKYLVAEASSRELWVTQHGSGYGFLEVQSSEDYERELASRYFTWGWDREVLPHPKLIASKTADYKRNTNIIFTFPTVTQYAGLLESYFIAGNYERTIALSTKLLDSLVPDIRAHLLLRQREKIGLRMYQPPHNLSRDTIGSFHESLGRARVHLTNHLGTPFLESLAMNIPTLVLYDPSVQRIRDSAVPLFAGLRKARILFDDAEQAAKHLNAVYDQIDEWWKNAQTQTAVKRFCTSFARSHARWKAEWLEALTRP